MFEHMLIQVGTPDSQKNPKYSYVHNRTDRQTDGQKVRLADIILAHKPKNKTGYNNNRRSSESADIFCPAIKTTALNLWIHSDEGMKEGPCVVNDTLQWHI